MMIYLGTIIRQSFQSKATTHYYFHDGNVVYCTENMDLSDEFTYDEMNTRKVFKEYITYHYGDTDISGMNYEIPIPATPNIINNESELETIILLKIIENLNN